MNAQLATALLLLLLVPNLTACDDDPTAAADDCASGFEFVGDDNAEMEMYPGEACVECHRNEGEGPIFSIAGTVYETVSERDLCLGLEGTKVVITDANGVEKTLTSNSSGNFAFEGSIATPYTAKLVDSSGKEMPMVTPQTNGDCNTCHSPGGTDGAAGRIYVY